jgi:hypothetical protein
MARKRSEYKQYLDKNDPENHVFTDAALQMVADNSAWRGKNWNSKMICAEIIYKGQRHEVWFSKLEIYRLSIRTFKPYNFLAGAIKKRLLNL